MLKKNEYNLMSTIFFYLNLSGILHVRVLGPRAHYLHNGPKAQAKD